MDVLTRHFSPLVRRVVNGIEALLAIAVCGLMTWVSWTYM
jgi:TRAP-type C4-dicarboxylate transport system permease small subunit